MPAVDAPPRRSRRLLEPPTCQHCGQVKKARPAGGWRCNTCSNRLYRDGGLPSFRLARVLPRTPEEDAEVARRVPIYGARFAAVLEEWGEAVDVFPFPELSIAPPPPGPDLDGRHDPYRFCECGALTRRENRKRKCPGCAAINRRSSRARARAS